MGGGAARGSARALAQVLPRRLDGRRELPPRSVAAHRPSTAGQLARVRRAVGACARARPCHGAAVSRQLCRLRRGWRRAAAVSAGGSRHVQRAWRLPPPRDDPCVARCVPKRGRGARSCACSADRPCDVGPAAPRYAQPVRAPQGHPRLPFQERLHRYGAHHAGLHEVQAGIGGPGLPDEEGAGRASHAGVPQRDAAPLPHLQEGGVRRQGHHQCGREPRPRRLRRPLPGHDPEPCCPRCDGPRGRGAGGHDPRGV
mmetsp:Transcript_7687/g.25304  ORF Transcript_7687/g.25304 Transcript_7687/m.25304 type:complete len:256 (-) Transcript_7687:1415-2182(-)